MHLLDDLIGDLQKSCDNIGGELPTQFPFDFGERDLDGLALAVRRVKDYGIKGIGHRHNAGQARDVFSLEAVVSIAVLKKNLKPGEQPKAHKRKPETLDSQLRMLKAAFGWLVRLGLVETNPFAKVSLPELDRREVKFVRQEDVAEFLDGLEQRYPGWAMPRLFSSVKAATACRLEDLCSLLSAQLQDGRLIFPADVTKNRSERYALLPAALYAALRAYKGKTHLWERYPAELSVVIGMLTLMLASGLFLFVVPRTPAARKRPPGPADSLVFSDRHKHS